MGAYAPESYEFFHYLAMLGAYAPEKWAQSLLFPLFCSLIFTIYKLFSWIYDKMVDFRRICYLLKSPDFDRKVGGHAPDYPPRIFACQGHTSGPEALYADAARIGADIVSPNESVNWGNVLNQARCTINQVFTHNIVLIADRIHYLCMTCQWRRQEYQQRLLLCLDS